MDLIITFLWILILSSLVWGIVCLFKKGRRLKGLVYIFVAPILLFIALGVLAAKDQNAKLDRIAQAEGFESHSAKREAEAKADSERFAANLILKIKDFPDEKTWKEANDLGIKRFAAYRLRNNTEVIFEYCIYTQESHEKLVSKQVEIDSSTSDETIDKLHEEKTKISEMLLNDFNLKTGLKGHEHTYLANNFHWNWYCRAAEQNWDVFTPAQAAIITFEDARTVKENLEDFYLANLYKIKVSFVVNDNSLSVACRIEDLKERHYLGCYFSASGGKISQYIIYTIGKSDDGRLLLSPLNGVASGHAKHLGIKEGGRTFLQGQYSGKVYLARIADSEDISAVLDLF